jgi:membrane protein required for colicin V production
MSIALVDWIFGGVLVLSFLLGAWRGLVFEVLSAANWVAAFFLAQWFALDMARLLPMAGYSEMVRYATGFIVVFVLVVFVGSWLARLVQRLFAAVGLQPADRALGAIFGLLRGVAVLLAATVVLSMTPFKASQLWVESFGVGVSLALLRGLQPVLPEEFGRHLPS